MAEWHIVALFVSCAEVLEILFIDTPPCGLLGVPRAVQYCLWHVAVLCWTECCIVCCYERWELCELPVGLGTSVHQFLCAWQHTNHRHDTVPVRNVLTCCSHV